MSSSNPYVHTWPTFIIVGAPRAGTTSLYHYLRNTEGVYMPRTKYITHFIGKTKGKLLNEEKYLEHFPMLKDPEKRMEQDFIWKKICEELDWEFIPTV